MGNENKTGLNELTERSSTTDADHYLHSSTTMGKYDCKSNVFAWEKYFLLNGTESRVAGGVIDAPIIFKRESGAPRYHCVRRLKQPNAILIRRRVFAPNEEGKNFERLRK